MNAKVVVRRNHGSYGNQMPSRRGENQSLGTVIVREKEPPSALITTANGYRHVGRKAFEEVWHPSYIQWVAERKKRYIRITAESLRGGIEKERRRERPFHLELSEQFAGVASEHLAKQGFDREDVRVVATGVFPTNKKAGTFFKVLLGVREYSIPSTLIQVHTT